MITVLVGILVGVLVLTGLTTWAVFATLDQQQQQVTAPEYDPNAQPPAPADAPAAAAAAEPGEQGASQQGIATLADPDWLQRVSAATGIPIRALAAYAGADIAVLESTGCRVGWNTLAGIGYVESHHGTLQGGGIGDDGTAQPPIIGIPLDGTSTQAIPDTDGGALDGDATWDRAVGPMQFIPSTWQLYGQDGSGDGIADPQNIDDAALSAATYLCQSSGGLEDADAWIAAVRSYNDTNDYQVRVASAAQQYADIAATQ